ncbi:MAG: M23 family metallopeptidase [Alphaproteobacteria bacterium]|nr:M23 family metallopeptidase [Alphaproteobacteria bacterium]
MVRKIEWQRYATLFSTVLFASVMLVGCVPETARTQLDWYPAGDAPPRVAHNTPPRAPQHRPRAPRNAPVQTVALENCPTPTPKPNTAGTTPAWYNASNTQPATYTPIPATGGLAFGWPLSGNIVSDFGAQNSGGRNDGINIAAPAGTPIHAAAAGTVSYAGNELRGYGNLVLIKHDGGYVTAYAHADHLAVARGDLVTKGQVIGYAGQTGDVTSPQLHFEIRRGVTPVNPRTLLTSRTASAY